MRLLPFRLVGGELEYIPKRPSCLLGHALDVGELGLGAQATARQPNDLHGNGMTEDVDGPELPR